MSQKKVLSLVLCLAMMLSVMVVGAGAAFTDQDKIVNTEAVDMCVALNIINGFEDGSFKPEGNITRAQACKMICVALNGGKEPATATKTTPTYADIDGHWAEGYIEYCSTKGIVAGVGGGNFDPEGQVTASQFAKMLLVALGYNADVEKYVGESWELYVNVQANQDGIYKDLEGMDLSAPLIRDNAAQMVWNTMQAYIINKSSSIDRNDGSISDVYTKSDSVDLLDKMYDGEIVKAQLTEFTYNSNDNDWTYTVGGIQVKSSVDYTDMLGQKVKAVYDKTTTGTIKDAYGIFVVDSQVVLTGVLGDLPDLATSDTSFKVDGTTYKLDGNVGSTHVHAFQADADVTKTLATISSGTGTDTDPYVYAYKTLNQVAAANVISYDAQYFEAIDYDGNGKIDFAMIYPMAVARISSITSDTIRLKSLSDPMSVLKVELDPDDTASYDGMVKGDYVAYTNAKNTADDTDTLVKADLVTGKVTKVSSTDRAVTIEDNVYTIDAVYTVPSAGTTLTKAVVVNDYIFYAESTVSADPEDYVVALSVDEYSHGDFTAKLLFSDNTRDVVVLDEVYGFDSSHPETSGATVKLSLTSGTPVVEPGQLYKYTVNSSDEYTLTAVADEANKSVGGKSSSANAKAAYIDSNTILDDSVIFVRYNPTYATDNVTITGYKDYKAITGAEMKTMKANLFVANNVKYVNASQNAISNVGDVNFAYVSYRDDNISADDTFYGYVCAVGSTLNSDGKKVPEFTLWTSEGEKVLETTFNCDGASSVTTNSVVIYTLNADGIINKIGQTIGDESVKVGTVTSRDEYQMYANGQANYFADDVQIVTVESKNLKGISTDGTYEDIDALTNGVINVFYVYDDNDDEVVFVAVDENQKIDGMTVTVPANQNVSTNAGTDAAIKELSDGLYTATAFIAGQTLSQDQLDDKSLYIFKYDAPIADLYTLSIKNAAGQEVLKDTLGTTTSPASVGPHFFLIDVMPYTHGAKTSSVTTSGTYQITDFESGTYTYTVSGATVGTVLTGSFSFTHP